MPGFLADYFFFLCRHTMVMRMIFLKD
jgi:hypothetical protein